MLSNAINDSSFLVTVEVMAYVMEVTKSLSILLQSTTIDLQVAISSVENCVSALERMRAEDEWFEKMFSKAGVRRGCPIEIPRRTGHQIHRVNVPVEDARSYYKRGVFYQFLDGVISQLRERFSSHTTRAFSLRSLLPESADRPYASIESNCLKNFFLVVEKL